jgi:hypothetical protein
MKTILKFSVIILAMLSITATAQVRYPYFDKSVNESCQIQIKDMQPSVFMHNTDAPFMRAEPSRNKMVPIEGFAYEIFNSDMSPVGDTIFYYTGTYRHSLDGKLLYVRWDPQLNHDAYLLTSVERDYNQTFTKENMNVLDTVTYTNIRTGLPENRYYFNYHYYDKFEIDSFYYEQVNQQWINGKWVNQSKNYEGYADTALWNITRFIQFEWNGTQWDTSSYWLSSLIYDERGFVTERLTKVYDAQSGTRNLFKSVYLLNDDGSVNGWDNYSFQNGAWQPTGKKREIRWHEWLGYGGELFDNVYYANMDNIPINGKRNKLDFGGFGWSYSNGVWIQSPYASKKYWNFDAYGSNTDTAFWIIQGELTKYPQYSIAYIYNDHGDYLLRGFTSWNLPDANGNQTINFDNGAMCSFQYNDYGWTEIKEWFFRLDTATNTYYKGWQGDQYVTKWGDPADAVSEQNILSMPLVVSPNPAQDAATVTASTAIRQLDLYDLTGRRIITQQCRGNTTVNLSLSAVPAGFYLLKATLQNGAVQNGKLVVR